MAFSLKSMFKQAGAPHSSTSDVALSKEWEAPVLIRETGSSAPTLPEGRYMAESFGRGEGLPRASESRLHNGMGGLQGIVNSQSASVFTARELVAILPQHLTRTDLSPDMPVELPVDALKKNLAYGRPSLMLSQIFNACPTLFSRPPLFSEEMEISLPYAKVRWLVENQPSEAMQPFVFPPRGAQPATGQAPSLPSPFQSPSDQPSMNTAETMHFSPAIESPFAVVDSLPGLPTKPTDTAAPNPFELADALPVSGPKRVFDLNVQNTASVPKMNDLSPMDDPVALSSTISDEGPKSPFGDSKLAPQSPSRGVDLPKPAAVEPAVTVTPRAVAPPAPAPLVEAAPAAANVVHITVSSLLKDLQTSDLGFEPSRVPAKVKVAFSSDVIRKACLEKVPFITLGTMVAALPERVQPAFVRARQELKLRLPLEEVLDFLPSPTLTPDPVVSVAPEPAAPKPLQSVPLFDQMASEDAKRIAPPPWATSINTPPKGLEELGKSYPAEELQVSPPMPAPGTKPPRLKSAAPAPITENVVPPSPFLAPVEPERPASPAMPEMLAPVLTAPSPFQSPPTPSAPPVAKIAVQAPISEDLGYGYQAQPNQIMLRAIFRLDRPFSLVEMLELASQQDGIAGAFYITPQKEVHFAGDEASVVGIVKASLPTAYEGLRTLVTSLNLPLQGSFTLRTDTGVRTFFLEKDICLVVMHSEPAFRSGIRERLLILLQEMANVSE